MRLDHITVSARLCSFLLCILFLTALSPFAKASVQSPWGYDLPVPYLSLSSYQQSEFRRLPLRSIGALKIRQAPFRTTAVYLGRQNGIHLFGVSEHAISDKKAYAVEFGQLTGQKIEISLAEAALFKSRAGDFAVLRAADNLTAPTMDFLNSLVPIKLEFRSLSTILAQVQKPAFFIAGRALHAAVKTDMAKFPELWKNPSAVKLWESAASEAAQNLDERPDVTARQGDVFAITRTNVMGSGLSVPLRDPDGLVIGSEVANPFLAARPDWAPLSLAGRYRSFGRMSGGPLLMLTRQGEVAMVGTHYTKGMPEDLGPLWSEIKKNPERAFGDVVMKLNPQGQIALSLSKTAPFAFASAMSQVGHDLRVSLSDLTNGLSQAEREALRGLMQRAHSAE